MRRPLAIALAAFSALASGTDDPATKRWIHGAPDCAASSDPAIDVFRYDDATYVLRQSKCVHYEAPFIYVLFGSDTVLVQDTGATADPASFPLADTIRALIAERGGDPNVLVVHSHGHDDHTAGDGQLRGQPRTTVVRPTSEAVRKQFGFTRWPDDLAVLDLGGRELLVLPIPGHHSQSIAIYDPRTRWLLTGDTLYPGQLYVEDWPRFRASIDRLVEFSRTHPVAAIMGTHVEISARGTLFPRGSTYQPDEAPLPLPPEALTLLAERLKVAGDESQRIPTSQFVVVPMPLWARTLNRVIRWFRSS